MTDFPDTEYTAGTRPDEASVPDYRPGTLVFGDWVVAEQLGAGAFGAVYRLQKHSYGFTTESAMKVIRIPQSQADVRSILSEGMDQGSATDYFRGVVDEIVQEIAVMAQLKSHPAIVSYEDHQILPHEGSIGWDILIRMELLTSLIDYQQKHPLQREDILALGTQLSSALAFCETRHLIHRDIKPENIFVNDTGFFKLGDFGVARTVERTSGSLSKKGTESYMAPEVYLGKPYGPSVDLYSLGLVLYRLCNHNRLPFFPAYPAPITFRAREDALSHRMRGDALPPPDQADPALSAVILKACAYHPEDRYPTASALKTALQQLAKEPAEPRQSGTENPAARETTSSGQDARDAQPSDRSSSSSPPPQSSPAEAPPFFEEEDFDKTEYILPGRRRKAPDAEKNPASKKKKSVSSSEATPEAETNPAPETRARKGKKSASAATEQAPGTSPQPQHAESSSGGGATPQSSVAPGPTGFFGSAEYHAGIQHLLYRRNVGSQYAALLQGKSGLGKGEAWVTQKFAEATGKFPLNITTTSGILWTIGSVTATAWLSKLLITGSTVVIRCLFPDFPEYSEEITLHLVGNKALGIAFAQLDGVADVVYVYGAKGKSLHSINTVRYFPATIGVTSAFSNSNPFYGIRSSLYSGANQ